MFGTDDDDDSAGEEPRSAKGGPAGKEATGEEATGEPPAGGGDADSLVTVLSRLTEKLGDIEEELTSHRRDACAVRSAQERTTESLDGVEETVRRSLDGAEEPIDEAPPTDVMRPVGGENDKGSRSAEPAGAAGAVEASARASGGTPSDAVVPLTDLPRGYAGDALVMEWLAMLVENTGPAGALHAIDYYERVGWIGNGVRDHLLDVLAGTDLDVQIDPSRPVEPTASEHAESYRYIELLDELGDR